MQTHGNISSFSYLTCLISYSMKDVRLVKLKLQTQNHSFKTFIKSAFKPSGPSESELIPVSVA